MVNPTTGTENYILGAAPIDYNISDKDLFFVRYLSDKANRNFDSGVGYWPELDLTHNQYATIEERRIISPKLVNIIHFSAIRARTETASVVVISGHRGQWPGYSRRLLNPRRSSAPVFCELPSDLELLYIGAPGRDGFRRNWHGDSRRFHYVAV